MTESSPPTRPERHCRGSCEPWEPCDAPVVGVAQTADGFQWYCCANEAHQGDAGFELGAAVFVIPLATWWRWVEEQSR